MAARKFLSNRAIPRGISNTDRLRNLSLRGSVDFGHTEKVCNHILSVSYHDNLNLKVKERKAWINFIFFSFAFIIIYFL